jgi:translation elongation factor EF-G
MSTNPPVNFERVEEMAEGDADFRAELIAALFKSLTELKEKYLEGAERQDLEILSQIRHKVKPALALFEIQTVDQIIQEGKHLLHEQGFGTAFLEHLGQFLDAMDEAIALVEAEMGNTME